MRIYSESATLTIPWEIYLSRLDSSYERTESKSDEIRWTVSSNSVYKIHLAGKADTGSIETVVSTSVPIRSGLVCIGLSLLGAIALGAPASVFLFLQFVSLGVALFLLVPRAMWPKLLDVSVPEGISVKSRQLTSWGMLPITYGFLAATLVFEGFYTRTIIVLLGFVGGGTYAVQSGFALPSVKKQPFLYAFPAIAALPVLLAVGNVVMFTELLLMSPVSMRTPLAVVFASGTVVSLWLFTVSCRRAVRFLSRLPNKPLQRPRVRYVWTAGFLILHSGMIVLCVVFITNVVDTPSADSQAILPVQRLRIGFEQFGLPAPDIAVSITGLVLISPAILVGTLWLISLVKMLQTRYHLQRRTIPLESVDEDIAVRLLETPRVIAHPLGSFLGEDSVVVSTGIVESLNHDELRAVIAHETYHLHHRDARWYQFASLFGVIVGGKNALVALYDYPEIEKKADRYAAYETSVESVITALRKLDNQQSRSEPFYGTEKRSVHRFLKPFYGVYTLLFGSVILEQAHASVDTRIRWLDQMNRSNTVLAD